MKFAFIDRQLASTEAVQSHWSVGALCRILGVSRSGYFGLAATTKAPFERGSASQATGRILSASADRCRIQ